MKNETYNGDEDKGHVEGGVVESDVEEKHVQGEKRAQWTEKLKALTIGLG